MTILSVTTALLAKREPLGNIGGDIGTGLGPFSDMYSLLGGGVGPASGALARIISTIIGVITIVAGLWFIINFMIAAAGMIFPLAMKKRSRTTQK